MGTKTFQIALRNICNNQHVVWIIRNPMGNLKSSLLRIIFWGSLYTLHIIYYFRIKCSRNIKMYMKNRISEWQFKFTSIKSSAVYCVLLACTCVCWCSNMASTKSLLLQNVNHPLGDSYLKNVCCSLWYLNFFKVIIFSYERYEAYQAT